jgi:hypothetical protein
MSRCILSHLYGFLLRLYCFALSTTFNFNNYDGGKNNIFRGHGNPALHHKVSGL